VRRIDVDAAAVEHNPEFFRDHFVPGRALLVVSKSNGYASDLNVAPSNVAWEHGWFRDIRRQAASDVSDDSKNRLEPGDQGVSSPGTTIGGIQAVEARESIGFGRNPAFRRPGQLAEKPGARPAGFLVVPETGCGSSSWQICPCCGNGMHECHKGRYSGISGCCYRPGNGTDRQRGKPQNRTGRRRNSGRQHEPRFPRSPVARRSADRRVMTTVG
jgi:hypothetical protein